MIRKILLSTLLLSLSPMTPASATSQRLTEDEKDAAYQLCYNEYISRGYDDGKAWQDCRLRVYGNESGPPPGPGRPRDEPIDCDGYKKNEFCNEVPK